MSLQFGQVAHQAGTYLPGFCSMKLQGIFLFSPTHTGWDASPLHSYPSIKSPGSHLYNRAGSGTVI